MVIRCLRLADYLEPGACFHFARTRLEPGMRPARHSHDFFELFWVEGGLVQHRVGGTSLRLAAGSLCFIRPHDAHALRAHGRPARIVNIAFWPRLVAEIGARHARELDETAFWSRAIIPEHRQLGRFQQATLNAWAQRLDAAGRGALPLEAFLLAVLGLLRHDVPLPDGADDAPGWLIEACLALRRPERLRQGVAGFVAVAGRDPAHVSRACKRFFGKPPSHLVAEARMALASRLLSGTGQPIADVAMEVGFDSVSHFYRLFRAHFGMTPRAYRLRHRRDLVGLATG